MKYGITRKINLGRWGLQFESIDLMVEDCDTKEQAMEEINEWRKEIIKPFEEIKKRQKDLKDGKIPFENNHFNK